ncbi:MAG: TM2 domain-containing protein [Planctomycetes bacterium]|nr:TM2 domain-containing protein [Planctomycetota bacterium]
MALSLALTFQGCMNLTPEQQRFYGLYLTDTNPSVIDAPSKNAAVATILSVILPGLGHVYLGEPGWAVAWLLLGTLTWPLGAPIAAYADTGTVNRAFVADAYQPVYMAQEARRRQEEAQRQQRREERLDDTIMRRGW